MNIKYLTERINEIKTPNDLKDRCFHCLKLFNGEKRTKEHNISNGLLERTGSKKASLNIGDNNSEMSKFKVNACKYCNSNILNKNESRMRDIYDEKSQINEKYIETGFNKILLGSYYFKIVSSTQIDKKDFNDYKMLLLNMHSKKSIGHILKTSIKSDDKDTFAFQISAYENKYLYIKFGKFHYLYMPFTNPKEIIKYSHSCGWMDVTSYTELSRSMGMLTTFNNTMVGFPIIFGYGNDIKMLMMPYDELNLSDEQIAQMIVNSTNENLSFFRLNKWKASLEKQSDGKYGVALDKA